MSKKEKFIMISESDHKWRMQQTPAVRLLYDEAAMACPFGDRWMPVETTLSKSTFRQCRRILEVNGYFRFRTVMDSTDLRRVIGWEVLNLHGSATKHFQDTPPGSKSRYEEFLESDYWQMVRASILERDNHTCQHCGAKKRLQVHHLTYEHHGEEHLYPEDLVTLCRGCHEAVHGMNAD